MRGAFSDCFSPFATSFFSSDLVTFLLPEIFFESGFFFESFCATPAPLAGRGAFRASRSSSSILVEDRRISFRQGEE